MDLHSDLKMSAYSVIKAIFRTIFILLNNLYAIPTHLLWMAMLRPLLINHPRLYNVLEGIGYSTLLHMVAFWNWTAGYTCEWFCFIFTYMKQLYMPFWLFLLYWTWIWMLELHCNASSEVSLTSLWSTKHSWLSKDIGSLLLLECITIVNLVV